MSDNTAQPRAGATTGGGFSGNASDEEEVLVADNVNEYVERERWKQILDAWNDARTALKKREERTVDYRRQHSPHETREVVRATTRAAVKAYVLECESLYQQTALGQQLWRNTQLASASALKLFTPQSPEADEEVASIDTIEFIGGTPVKVTPAGDRGAAPTVMLGGVRDYTQLDGARVRYEYTVSIPGRNSAASEPRTGTASVSVPVSFSESAFRATNALLNHLGPGLEFGENQQTVDGDYSDLLDKISDE